LTPTPPSNPLLPFPVKTNRDVLLFEFLSGEVLVVGCDSAGGIGPKPLDKLKVDGFILGKFTARAALMEVLAVGANPVCVVDALGVEPEPLGAEILRGIRDEAEKAGLDPKLAVTGSTEKNIAVEQTGIGVTVVGTCRKEQLKIGTAQAGDVVVAVGVPCVGAEVLAEENQGKIAESTDVWALRRLEFVHEIIPVGSTGIAHEVETLAKGAKLKFTIAEQQEVDVKKSAGPATVVLAALSEQKLSELKNAVSKPINCVAHLSN
jgi:hypothetical protein